MSWELPYPIEQHQARLLVNDPQAQAYAWILAYADQLSNPGDPDSDDDYGTGEVSAHELISTAWQWIENPNAWNDHINKGALLDGESTDPLFWEKMAQLFKIEIPDSVAGANFFTCSC